ncbi:MAG TPA: protein kinase [Gemmataceae bacterium]|jgi:S1-C subfamily serine protease|nr:protein kinase [Gemmataceae bacterium]
MSAAWTCDRNHRWGVADDAATVDVSPVCPECGGVGRPLDGNETLPPAEEPVPVPSLAEVHVPGYELLAELGRGAMGVVYRAREEKLGRVVALKMILAGGHASASDRARFKREAEAVAALRHPNIVQIYAVGETGGLPYCALEFIEGGNLAEHAAGKRLPSERAAALVEELARAVHFAHEHGIVHRDLKPANVLLDADGTPKVADFGLAKKVDSATGPTATGAVLGTPAYMAPEQAGGAGKTVGPAADVYALGAILYDLLTGRPPFQAATPLDTILQVISTEPSPPRAVNPKVPRDLETVTLKCLRKEPGKRYASAAELAEDLRRWQAGEPVTARPQGRGERLMRGLKRRRGWLIAGGAAGLTLLVTTFMQLLGGPDALIRMVHLPTQPDRLPAVRSVTPPPKPSQTPPVADPQPAPTVVTAATLEQAKEAVVAVRATRSGTTVTGTGFLAVEPGIVVTTLPVLGMDHPLTPPPDRIEITLRPGTQDAIISNARLLSVDRSEHLACLQIGALGLPPVFALGPSADVREGQRVYVAGIPRSAPNIQVAMKVRQSVVTGMIMTRERSLKYIQIEGEPPGVGAPLIAPDGRLLGTIVGGDAQSKLRFAIPAESVGWLLRERVQSLRPGQSVLTDKGSRLPVVARVADPLNRLWKLSLDFWTGDSGPTRSASEGKPRVKSGDDERRTFPLTPRPNDRAGPGEDRDFVGTLDLPPLPAGKAYWVQPHFRTSRGTEHFGDAVMLPDAGPPVERVPVRLALNPSAWPMAERRLDLNVVRQMSVNVTGNKYARDDRDYSATVAEQSEASEAEAEARLKWRFPSYRLNAVDMPKAIEAKFKDYIAGLTQASDRIELSSEGGIATEHSDLSGIAANIRPQVEGLVRELGGTLRAAHPPVPNRIVRPGDSWPTEVPFLYPSGRSPTQGTFHLTLTYVGSRGRAGRREAIVEISGDMTPTGKDDGGSPVGRTLGAYAIDLETGMVRMAHVESDIIFALEAPAGPNDKPAKTKVGMVYEIRFQRGPKDGPPLPAVMPLPNGRIDFRPFVPLPGNSPS